MRFVVSRCRAIWLLVFVIPAGFLFANDPSKDFLITLNGSKLTGNIKNVSLVNGKSELVFENDFGDIYLVHPATIYGFSFEEGGEVWLFESKFLKGKWRFLRASKKGEALTLYTSSERQLLFTESNKPPIIVEEKNPQIWLQFKGEQPFKVYRFSYKRVLRKRIASFPDLTKKIGKRGFRYKNLSLIVESYNKYHSKKK